MKTSTCKSFKVVFFFQNLCLPPLYYTTSLLYHLFIIPPLYLPLNTLSIYIYISTLFPTPSNSQLLFSPPPPSLSLPLSLSLSISPYTVQQQDQYYISEKDSLLEMNGHNYHIFVHYTSPSINFLLSNVRQSNNFLLVRRLLC